MPLSKSVVEQAVTEIAMMPFFPGSDDESRAVLLKHVYQICSTDDQVRWLAGRFTILFPKWPGLRELRALACSKFEPKDHIEIYSEAYPDGIPSEKESRPMIEAGNRAQITAPKNRALIAGLLDPEEQEQYRKVNEAIARRNGDLPKDPDGSGDSDSVTPARMTDGLAEPTPVRSKPKTPEELARLDALRLEIDQLRAAELARRAQEHPQP